MGREIYWIRDRQCAGFHERRQQVPRETWKPSSFALSANPSVQLGIAKMDKEIRQIRVWGEGDETRMKNAYRCQMSMQLQGMNDVDQEWEQGTRAKLRLCDRFWIQTESSEAVSALVSADDDHLSMKLETVGGIKHWERRKMRQGEIR